MTDTDDLLKAVRRTVKETSEWDKGCPFLNSIHWGCLWPARSIEGVREAVTTNMGRLAKSTGETGKNHLVLWDILRVCGEVDTPEAAALVEKTIPVILRCQKPNGGWDGIDEGHRASFYTLRAMQRHGLLEALRNADPLPPEWRITKTIPVPVSDVGGRWSRLTWDGSRFWVGTEQREAIAVAPQDGRVLAGLELPGDPSVPDEPDMGLWWWRDSLLVRRWPKTLYLVDPETGETKQTWTPDAPEWVNAVIPFGDRLFLTDYYHGCTWELDPESGEVHRPEERSRDVYAPTVQNDDTVWGYQVQSQYILRFDLKGQLLEWAGNPFVGEVRGLAWDGQDLWALDAAEGRICCIERIPQQQE